MGRVSVITKVSIGLVALTLSLVTGAQFLNLLPDRLQLIAEGRARLCEALALGFAAAVQTGSLSTADATARSIVGRDSDLLSIGLRSVAGEVLFQTVDHEQQWTREQVGDSTLSHIEVPIFRNEERWATAELRFRPLVPSARWWFLHSPVVQLLVFLAVSGFVAYRLYLRRILTYLDPSKVIPGHVKAAFDTLAEGVLILDDRSRIVLANESFCKAAGTTCVSLQGTPASGLSWLRVNVSGEAGELPWNLAANTGTPQKGLSLRLKGVESDIPFTVNASPIVTSGGQQRGVLATFNDVSGIERQKVALEEMVRTLEESREKIRTQNNELTLLATCDPLTGCLNRRAFLDRAEQEWRRAKRNGGFLSCLMVDIDHFKSVNDRHGHRAGDGVLQRVAAILQQSLRTTDIVCRFGGEEFCVLLPETRIDDGLLVAEKLLGAIAQSRMGGISITASFGLATADPKLRRVEELIEQADQALYGAKNSGRNRTVRRDRMPDSPNPALTVSCAPRESQEVPDVPLYAVSALLSALGYRDPMTAAHSRRVADLSVALAADLIPACECFILEIAAMLHDIGKIGVPDSILLKPGPLTPEEWKVMGDHERIGIEIISSAFRCSELTTIVRNHHAFFAGSDRHPGMPRGVDIPLRARILTIADAYDAMVNDRPYRKALPQAAAISELRSCAGTHFDPCLVERFIEVLEARGGSQRLHSLSEPLDRALRIGMQTERLMAALDANDFASLNAVAARLAAVASSLGLHRVAELAAQLSESVASKYDLQTALSSMRELLDLCHSEQTALLSKAGGLSEERYACDTSG
mgnify:CR=1 FL=1